VAEVMVFRLDQPSRTILSRWKRSAWASSLVLLRPVETTARLPDSWIGFRVDGAQVL